jgi:hypothetical protein
MTTEADYRLAAKAAGYEIDFLATKNRAVIKRGDAWGVWQPTTNSADAFDLACHAKLVVHFNEHRVFVFAAGEQDNEVGIEFDAPCERQQAARLAIFEKAMRLGEQMGACNASDINVT